MAEEKAEDAWGSFDADDGDEDLPLLSQAQSARSHLARHSVRQSRRAVYASLAIVSLVLLCYLALHGRAGPSDGHVGGPAYVSEETALEGLKPMDMTPADTPDTSVTEEDGTGDLEGSDWEEPLELPDTNGPSQAVEPEHHASMVQGNLLDTRPPAPSLLPRPERERYISYLPHSGLHNQRIELENALLLAHLTNRTLLLPLARLGLPLAWNPFKLLTRFWRDQQKSSLEHCKAFLPQLESHQDPEDLACRYYARYTQVSWEFLVDLDHLKVPVRLVERNNLDRDWLTADDGLGLAPESIHTFEDQMRYSYRFYDLTQDTTPLRQYHSRINIDELASSTYAHYDLLEFGSMFGSSRLMLHKPETRQMRNEIEASLMFSMPLLDVVADAIEKQLGGRANYVALHLRVGDGRFKRNAIRHMNSIFQQLCRHVYRMDGPLIERMLKEARRSSGRISKRKHASNTAWTFLDSEDAEAKSTVPMSKPSPRSLSSRQLGSDNTALTCRAPLHTDSALQVLNTPVYIATDSSSPLTDPALAPFVRWLPCIYFLSDFRESVPALPALGDLRSKDEGVKMSRFLTPLLEAMLAARGREVIGTSGSTFSHYVTSSLHDHYWP